MNKKICRDMNSNCRYVNSNYIETLEDSHKLRYTSNLTSINDRDPYSAPDGEWEKSTDRPELLPSIAYIVNYLFFRKGHSQWMICMGTKDWILTISSYLVGSLKYA